jgi:hypothetical protein
MQLEVSSSRFWQIQCFTKAGHDRCCESSAGVIWSVNSTVPNSKMSRKENGRGGLWKDVEGSLVGGSIYCINRRSIIESTSTAHRNLVTPLNGVFRPTSTKTDGKRKKTLEGTLSVPARDSGRSVGGAGLPHRTKQNKPC